MGLLQELCWCKFTECFADGEIQSELWKRITHAIYLRAMCVTEIELHRCNITLKLCGQYLSCLLNSPERKQPGCLPVLRNQTICSGIRFPQHVSDQSVPCNPNHPSEEVLLGQTAACYGSGRN